MVTKYVKFVAAVLILSFVFANTSNAQWVFLGRKAANKISHLASQNTGNKSDVATVLLEAKADNVYLTAVNLLKANQSVKITRKDDATRSIDFIYGQNTASMKISSLQDNFSQLIIMSEASSGKQGDTSFVVESVFRVCREMGVECGLAGN